MKKYFNNLKRTGAIVFTIILSAFACAGAFTLSKYIIANADTAISNGDVYYIKNVGSGRYLDVYDGKTNNGTKVIQWSFNGGNNQKWRAVYNSNGTYCLEPLHAPGKRLETTNYKGVIHQDNHNGMKFYLNHVSNGEFKIVILNNTNNVMMVSNNNNGTQIQETGYNSSNSRHRWVFESVDDFGTIAELSVFSSQSGSGFGHSWIVIENKTLSNITAGKMTITAGQSASIGRFPDDIHGGIWYNRESRDIANNGNYNGRVSLTMEITLLHLITINSEIINGDSYDLLWDNCATLAVDTWNSVAPSNKKIHAWTWGQVHFPEAVKEEILDLGGQTNKIFPYNTNTGYYNGDTFVAHEGSGGSSGSSSLSSFSPENETLLMEYYNSYLSEVAA
jgi:hypothetical protein